jgi:hypothetical protein
MMDDQPKGGFKNSPQAPYSSGRNVGKQAPLGKPVGGADVMAVSNPKGTSPKKLGGGMKLPQDPVQPKVGK